MIAILTAGVLPVPPVKGGAVENLIEYILQYNERKTHYPIKVYGIKDDNITPGLLSKYSHCQFDLIKTNGVSVKIKRFIYKLTHTSKYYHSTDEYFAYQAIRKIQKEDCDMLLIENRPYFVIEAYKKIQRPIVLHLHNDTLYKDLPESENIVNHLSKVFTVSTYLQKRVNAITSSDNKAITIYNGIDLSRFSDIRPLYDREHFHLSVKDFVVVFVGRIERIKGINELLEAFQLLIPYTDIKLLLIGGSGYGDSVENTFVQEVNAKIQQMNNKVISTGYIPHRDIPSILHLCDIGIIPSICEEALSLSALESLACGLPLIITRSGGLPETVNNKCAITVEKNNKLPHNLAEAILNLYNHPEKRKNMAIHAKERAKQFSKEKYAKEIFDALNSINTFN